VVEACLATSAAEQACTILNSSDALGITCP